MCSDGVIESNTEYNNKEIWVKDLLENIETEDVQKIADLLINESIDNGLGFAKDDMTVLVAKIY
jgi:stage II sporulation protein E